MYVINEQIETSIPQQILDASGDPVTTLVTADFGVVLIDPDGTNRAVLVAIAHEGSGIYSISFTPDKTGLWRLTVSNSTYGVEAFEQYDVQSVHGTTSGELADGVLTSLAGVKNYLADKATDYTDQQINTAINVASAEIEKYCNRTFHQHDVSEWLGATDYHKVYASDYPIINMYSVKSGLTDYLAVRCTSNNLIYAQAVVNGNRLVLTSQVAGDEEKSTVIDMTTHKSVSGLATYINGNVTGWNASTVLDGAVKQLFPTASGDATAEVRLQGADNTYRPYDLDADTGAITLRSTAYPIYVRYSAGYAVIPDDLIQAATELTVAILDSPEYSAAVKSETLGDYSYTLSDTANSPVESFHPRLDRYKKFEL